MIAKMGVFRTPEGFGIAWIDDDENYGESDGLYLGEDGGDDAEHMAATNAARAVRDPEETSGGGLCWHTATDAKAALRVAKAAVKALRECKPWPEWATTALAAGWKPPKGWAP